MASIEPAEVPFPVEVDTLIIGAGAAGMVAALAAHERGQSCLIIERDVVPSGSTALSAGLIPAAGTRFQRASGVADDPETFAADIQRKAQDENDPALVELLTKNAAQTIEWLVDRHGLPFSLVDNFDYPGHSNRRMHGLPSRSGQELIDRLRAACEDQVIDILCEATATTLYAEGATIQGIAATRPDGTVERIGCQRLILACNGYGGDAAKVRSLMPEISDALWFGHDGNKGDALDWGQALGAATEHLGAYQGHGNVAQPDGILITWAVMTEGGFQVNRLGERFWDESRGYSEAARAVLSQPNGEAFAIFDERIAGIARQFADFQTAEAQGAVLAGDTPEALASRLGIPAGALAAQLDDIDADQPDRFGRDFGDKRLQSPFMGLRVTGALFHTQGGLVVDRTARVRRLDGSAFANLYAVGGAAVGVSGAGDSGYLSGNGLLSAVVLGWLAGNAS